MIESTTILAIGLSWTCGFMLMRAAFPDRGDCSIALQLGFGFFAGMALTVTLIAGLRVFGLGMSWPLIAALLILFAVVAWVISPSATAAPGSSPGLLGWLRQAPSWQTMLFSVLLAWVLARLLLIGLEAGLRPLFPWDAWMHWSPKARLWIETGQWLEFGSRAAWLGDPARETYTIRNWSYPEFVPYVQLWSLMPLGAWHEVAFGYAWVALYAAMALMVYGVSRGLGLTPLAAIVVAWILVSIPFLHVHVALPGYADLWLGGYVGASAGGILLASRSGDRRWLALAGLMALVCAWIKVPGLAWMLVLAVCAVSTLLDSRRLLLLAAAGLGLLIFVFAIGVDITVPGLGRIAASRSGIQLPMIGAYEWTYNPVLDSVWAHLTMSDNWHLLWPVVAGAWLAAIPMLGERSTARTAWLLLTLGASFLLLALLFTSRGAELEVTQVTHRAFIPLAVLAVICLPAIWNARKGGEGRAEFGSCEPIPSPTEPGAPRLET